MVLHLDHTSGTALDSTSNDTDGTEVISPDSDMDTTLKIDGADEFTGNDYIDMGDTTILDGKAAYTIEAWVNFNTLGAEYVIARKWYSGGQAFLFSIDSPNADELHMTARDSGGRHL